MTPHARIRRIGWIAALAICTVLYLLLVLKGHSIRSDVIAAERQLVQLERNKLLLETEFLSLTNQVQLARWNRVEFGYVAPAADQFISSERELARLGDPRDGAGHDPILLAGYGGAEDLPRFPQLVSPLTGKPVDDGLLQPEAAPQAGSAAQIAFTMAEQGVGGSPASQPASGPSNRPGNQPSSRMVLSARSAGQ